MSRPSFLAIAKARYDINAEPGSGCTHTHSSGSIERVLCHASRLSNNAATTSKNSSPNRQTLPLPGRFAKSLIYMDLHGFTWWRTCIPHTRTSIKFDCARTPRLSKCTRI
jgi:hypothetical protein